MHDRHGRQIEQGDVVWAKLWTGTCELVKVIGANAQSNTCNLYGAAFEPRLGQLTLNANETTLIMKANGSLVGPPDAIPEAPPAQPGTEPKEVTHGN